MTQAERFSAIMHSRWQNKPIAGCRIPISMSALRMASLYGAERTLLNDVVEVRWPDDSINHVSLDGATIIESYP